MFETFRCKNKVERSLWHYLKKYRIVVFAFNILLFD